MKKERRRTPKERSPRRTRPDQQARVKFERLRQQIRNQDETVTAVELVSDPMQQADGRYAVEAWLYRIGTSSRTSGRAAALLACGAMSARAGTRESPNDQAQTHSPEAGEWCRTHQRK